MPGEQFKCLIFILGPKGADIRSRLHNKMDTAADPTTMTLNALAEEAGRLIKLKHEVAPVLAIKHKRGNARNFPHKQAKKTRPNNNCSGNSPRYPCWRCGAMHFTKDCYFCTVGHKEEYCRVGQPGKSNYSAARANVVKLLQFP